MFSYVFCDRMKLIQDAIRLPLAWLYVAVIMGLWLVLLLKIIKRSRGGLN